MLSAFGVTRVWGGFLTGALLSGAATPRFGVWVLLVPFLILLVLAVHSGAGDKLNLAALMSKSRRIQRFRLVHIFESEVALGNALKRRARSFLPRR